MAEIEANEVELQPRHRRQVLVLAALTHLGLVVTAACAVYTLQPPTFGMKRWAGLGLVALVMLGLAAVTRGRSAFLTVGKLLTALAAGVALSLAVEPQLANMGTLGERMPMWLLGVGPNVAMIAVVWTAVFGLLYLHLINSYLGHGHEAPFRWGLNLGTLVIIVLAIASFVMLGRLYEMDMLHLSQLLGNALTFYLLLVVVLNVSGRIGFGASMQVYLALTLLLALARNLVGGGGEQ